MNRYLYHSFSCYHILPYVLVFFMKYFSAKLGHKPLRLRAWTASLIHPSLYPHLIQVCLAHRKYSSVDICYLNCWGLLTLSAITLPFIWIFQTSVSKCIFFSLVGALVPWQRNWFDLEVCLKSWRLVLLPAAIKTMQWDTFQKSFVPHLNRFGR